MRLIALRLTLIHAVLACAAALIQPAFADGLDSVPELPVTIVKQLPHDARVFTQGMAIHGGVLIESSGIYGRSAIFTRTLDNTKPIDAKRTPKRWFAEGLAVHNNTVWLITWREGIAQQLSLPALEPLSRWRYDGEGWGLTSDGDELVMSDGSEWLRWRTPTDFSVTRNLRVHAAGQPIKNINELEWVNGWILANIWQSEWIIGIDPDTGGVAFKLSTRNLLTDSEQQRANVANGIALDASSGKLYISGKYWPKMFEIAVDLPSISDVQALMKSAAGADSL